MVNFKVDSTYVSLKTKNDWAESPLYKHLQPHLRLLDLKTLQAADFSGEHFVHVDVVVELQLILPDTEGGNGCLRDTASKTADQNIQKHNFRYQRGG